MSASAACSVCGHELTNPPAKLDLPDGSAYVLVHEACAERGLSAAQVRAIKAALAAPE